jgi:hypothetical protein
MHDTRFDSLTRRLSLAISRRRAARSLAALAAGLAPALMPEASQASAKKRCRKHKGVWLPADPTSPCRCALTCRAANTDPFICGPSPSNCLCYEKADDGLAFCAANILASKVACTASAQCDTGETCVVQPGCPGAGQVCGPGNPCPSSGTLACLNHTCQSTLCLPACPA